MILGGGAYTTTLDDLMFKAITTSDTTSVFIGTLNKSKTSESV